MTTNSGREYRANIVAILRNNSDLALIKINANEQLPLVKFADSNDVKVGQRVLAIGCPFGFKNTLTTGIISRIDYERNKIQTDASINPGCSGGPLLNLVLGIPLMLLFGEFDYLFTFGLLNVMTAVSNLLPIEGYDGYKIFSFLLCSCKCEQKYEGTLLTLSFIFSACLALFALYLILVLGEGYWTFAIFFTSFLSSLYKKKKHTFFEKT